MDGNINELLSNLINPLTCSCGSIDLEYVGMGEYKCNHCGKKILNDFGCVYEYVYAHPNASISEVAQATGVKEEDIDSLAQDAYNDACRPGNPKDVTIEDIKELFKSLM